MLNVSVTGPLLKVPPCVLAMTWAVQLFPPFWLALHWTGHVESGVNCENALPLEFVDTCEKLNVPLNVLPSLEVVFCSWKKMTTPATPLLLLSRAVAWRQIVWLQPSTLVELDEQPVLVVSLF